MLALWSWSACAMLTPPIDAKMGATYDMLAKRAVSLHEAASNPTVWIGIGGGPGAGKSTLAAAVAGRVNRAQGRECCVVLPMDGFHYSRAQLCALDPPDAASYLPRRGAPWTFDAEALLACLSAAKQAGAARLPTYCRTASDPVSLRLQPVSTQPVAVPTCPATTSTQPAPYRCRAASSCWRRTRSCWSRATICCYKVTPANPNHSPEPSPTP